MYQLILFFLLSINLFDRELIYSFKLFYCQILSFVFKYRVYIVINFVFNICNYYLFFIINFKFHDNRMTKTNIFVNAKYFDII